LLITSHELIKPVSRWQFTGT